MTWLVALGDSLSVHFRRARYDLAETVDLLLDRYFRRKKLAGSQDITIDDPRDQIIRFILQDTCISIEQSVDKLEYVKV